MPHIKRPAICVHSLERDEAKGISCRGERHNDAQWQMRKNTVMMKIETEDNYRDGTQTAINIEMEPNINLKPPFGLLKVGFKAMLRLYYER